MMNTLRITEIFYSLQGETRSVGCPTVFVRLTGCPLRCHYCDTAYAFSGGTRMVLEQILQRVASYGAHYVTVTGGEPLAQPECLTLLECLADAGYEVSLETSGALDVAGVDPRVVKVLDLKGPSSGEAQRNCYGNIDHLLPHDQVKFVVADEEDYQWAKAAMERYELARRCEVLFSPCAGRQNPTELADKILRDRLPVRLQLQLHKLLWGNEPGR
ncbi:MAG: 7-carboxy-7-deazaguanine synthase QueE [Methylococcaceae bacterium]|nr:MAG: 7-carboxy-7-deazaguanine synthase QueE [Methylococcaceae bacterium]